MTDLRTTTAQKKSELNPNHNMVEYPLELDLTVDLIKRPNTIFVGVLPLIRQRWRRADVIFQEFPTSSHWQSYKLAVPGSPDAVILKIFKSHFGNELFDRCAKAQKLLNDAGIGPKLLVVFANAIVTECVYGRSLNSTIIHPSIELLEPENMQRLAETLARVHSEELLQKAEKFKIEKNFDGIHVDDEKCSHALEQEFQPFRVRGKLHEFKVEIGKVTELLRALKCEKSLCYMDMSSQYMYLDVDGKIVITECDFTSISYSVVDLAASLQMFTRTHTPHRSDYPNDSLVRHFAKCYLNAKSQEETNPTEKDLEQILIQIRAGRLLVLLRLTILGPLLKAYSESGSRYDQLNYGKFCWDLYSELYEEVAREVETYTKRANEK